MDILMVNRDDAISNYGGDTTQMLKTRDELEKLGQNVDIVLGSQKKEDYKKYDIIHLFNLQTANFGYKEALKIKENKQPLILSSIWWDFYDDYINSLKTISSESFIDIVIKYLISISFRINYKYTVNPKQRIILKISDKVLPNSYTEAELLKNCFSEINNDKVSIIPNGVSNDLFSNRDNELPIELKDLGCVSKGYALQVGRIDSGKNVLSTIIACRELDIPLVIIGKEGENKYFKSFFGKYMKECKKAASKTTYFLGSMEINNIIPYYKNARIHILPSIRETPGLTNLEAAALGCNIVTTKIGSTREYFEDLAFYCDPFDLDDIKNAINDAWNSKVSYKLKERINNKYTWKKAAELTLECYNEVIDG